MVCRVDEDGRVHCAGTGLVMGNYDDVVGDMLDSREDLLRAIDEELEGLGASLDRLKRGAPEEARERLRVKRVRIPGLAPASAVTVGQLHACAVSCRRRLQCWGLNLAGQLGDGTTERRDRPVTPSDLPPVVSADAGTGHTCAVARQGEVYCWGHNEAGQVGASLSERHLVPRRVEDVGSAVDVALGDRHSCALYADGTISCWGFGTPTFEYDRPSGGRTRHRKLELDEVEVLVSGHDHVCALRSDESVWCWGGNFEGQAQPGSDERRILHPQRVSEAPPMIALAAGAEHTCGLTENGSAHCWGNDRRGRLRARAQKPPELRAVAAGAEHSCGLTDGGELHCWGGLDHYLPPGQSGRIPLP